MATEPIPAIDTGDLDLDQLLNSEGQVGMFDVPEKLLANPRGKRIVIEHARWPEAEVVAQSIKCEKITTPRLLVRRRESGIEGPNGEELIYHAGLPCISLFTGCGGMDLGTESAGFVTAVQHERDETCCDTLIANRPNYFRHAALIQGDIRTTPTSYILAAGGLRVGEAHLLTGGPPCQGFSIAGKRRLDDTRNDLVFHFLRVVREAQPKFFVMENVQGFVSFNKHEYLKAYLEEAYGCYYELVYGLVDAANHGVPQHRVRFICMGTRRDLVECDGMLGSLPEPTHFSPEDLKLVQIPEAPLFSATRASKAHPPGIRYFPDRPVLIPPVPTNGGHMSQKYMDFYDKLERDEPDRIVREPVHAD